MFTGLVEDCGQVIKIQKGVQTLRFVIRTHLSAIAVGDSIAVEGVCLTVAQMAGQDLEFDVSPETLALTTLQRLEIGSTVNLERAMQATNRFGGHYVSGHVDHTVCLQARQKIGEYIEMVIGGFTECDILYLLPKGSIALNGVSLTINAVEDQSIKVLLVPHTLAKTTLQHLQVGDALNVEFDYLAKLIAHQVKREFARFTYDKSI